MTEEKVVMICHHYGNDATFEVRGQYRYENNMEDPEGNMWVIDETVWQLLECTKCSMPTLKQTRFTQDLAAYDMPLNDEFPYDGKTVETILYPLATHLTNLYPFMAPVDHLPVAIEREYKAALQERNRNPEICAMYVGRTLEAICNHESAKGSELADKLNHLANIGRIPRRLAQMAHQSRKIRNLGVHVTGEEITFKDLPFVLYFLEVILEYLYETSPADR